MTALKIQRHDFRYTANLTTPAFALVGRWVELAAAMVEQFASFGATPESLVFESASGHPKDFVLACHLPSAPSTVRFRLRALEVWTAGAMPVRDPKLRGSLISEAFSVLATLEVNPALDTQMVALSCHGELAEGTFAGRIGEYVGKTPSAMDVTGMTFHRDLGAAGQAFIDFQPSYALLGPSSVFISTALRGAKDLSAAEALAEGVRLFETSLRDLVLEPDWSTLE